MKTQTLAAKRTLLWASALSAIVAGWGVLATTAANGEPAYPPGLYVHNGTLMHAGKPYAAIGANYDTLFGRVMNDKDNTSSLDNLGLLAAKGIPFVRFRAGGFRPQNWDLYLHDRAEYFRRFDMVVRAAEKDKIGLIPSLFWKMGTIPRLVGEPLSELGDPSSRSIAFIKTYTSEVVGRYKDSPALWGWEFGNEANLGVDLRPNGGRGFFNPSAEAEGNGGVNLTSAQLQTAFLAFANAARAIDPTRIIEPGTSVPRPAGWHNAHGQLHVRDSLAQNYGILAEETPDPMNVMSVHIYQKAERLAPYGPESLSHFIARFKRAAAAVGKPLFIGEFPVTDRTQTQTYLDAIVQDHVPLSAFWVFDNQSQEAHMNISFQNARAFVIDMVVAANKSLQSSP